jgi:hypothetical protein
MNAGEVIEQYALGDIEVTVRQHEIDTKVVVTSIRGDAVFEFVARHYEYEHYNRLMNKRIRDHFKS